MFCKRCKGLESDKPLDGLWDTLRKNFKITYILEGASLKLWWVGSVKYHMKFLLSHYDLNL